MTKADLIEQISQIAELTRKDSEVVVETIFESIVHENRSVVSIIDCDYTFLNGTLASVYGLEKTVTGPAMRKVRLLDRYLSADSAADRANTSPPDRPGAPLAMTNSRPKGLARQRQLPHRSPGSGR